MFSLLRSKPESLTAIEPAATRSAQLGLARLNDQILLLNSALTSQNQPLDKALYS
jgi:hypothetical protein